jgi:RimJ/RimL family protein N-acetyltransferase
MTTHYPLAELTLVTPRLRMRLPDLAELDALGQLAADGVHDPEAMPFLVPWTRQAPAERARAVVVYHFKTLGDWTPTSWALPFTVFLDGEVVGQQTMSAKNFAVTRECATGSWLGQRFHGQGIGTEMRAAVVHLAFAGLGAIDVVSGAFIDNPASLRVSAKLGYQPDGLHRYAVLGRSRVEQRLRLTRADWERRERVPVTIEGLDACLPMLVGEATP